MTVTLPTLHTRLPSYLALPVGGLGLALLVLAALRCLGLSLGSAAAHVFVLCILLALALVSMSILAQRTIHWSLLCPALAAVGLAFFLRVLCLEHQTLDYQDFLAKWAAFSGRTAALPPSRSRWATTMSLTFIFWL